MPSGNKLETAVLVTFLARSLALHRTTEPQEACDILVANVGPEIAKTAKCAKIAKKCAKPKKF